MAGLVSQQESFSVNVSPSVKCWRVIYNPLTKVVIRKWEGAGLTKTANSVFVSDPTDGPGAITSAEGEAQAQKFIVDNKLRVVSKPKKFVRAARTSTK